MCSATNSGIHDSVSCHKLGGVTLETCDSFSCHEFGGFGMHCAKTPNTCDGTANGAVDGSIGSAIEEGEAGDVVGGRMLEHVQVLARLGLGVARPYAPEETAHLPKGHQVRCNIDIYVQGSKGWHWRPRPD